MRVCRITIKNFRGIKTATISLPEHAVLIGDNNVGKTTIFEAMNLVLGPDRLNQFPPIDEHDFFRGKYLDKEDDDGGETPLEDGQNSDNLPITSAYNWFEDLAGPVIDIEVVIIDLIDEQKARFNAHLEFWDTQADTLYEQPSPEGTDQDNVIAALRVSFLGWYDREEDDFKGKTYFSNSLPKTPDQPNFLLVNGQKIFTGSSLSPDEFTKKDKQFCGFLYLRSLRTANRALSLQRGSLLDIILRVKEVRPKIWEDILDKQAKLNVAFDPDLGISEILESINNALQKYVPKEWGSEPRLKVSNLTREHLRDIITAFIATGDDNHTAPFYRQGTGTLNIIVLAMLSQIAVDKQNVIFAMEEPETAIPPYAQKRIVHQIQSLASQALFSSHSPYVLEEFSADQTVVLNRNSTGDLFRQAILLPSNLKPKQYKLNFRTRYCEGLLARRVLIAEGATEALAFPSVCRHLAVLNPDRYKSLEALGICTIDAGGEKSIAALAKLYKNLGKRVFALCDKQDSSNHSAIRDEVDILLMHDEKGIENLVLKGTTETALQRFAFESDLIQSTDQVHPYTIEDIRKAVSGYFLDKKGNGRLEEFLLQCSEDEIPVWLREKCLELLWDCEPNQQEEGG